MNGTSSEKRFDELVFEAPFGRAEQTLGAITLVLVIVVGFVFQVGISTRGGDTLLWKVIGFIPIAVAGFLWFGSPRRYTLGEDSLRIYSVFSRNVIPYNEIRKVEFYREGEIQLIDNSFLPSNLMIYLHCFRHPVYGILKSKSNSIFPAVIVIAEKEAYLLSTSDNSSFVRALKSRIK